MSIFKKIQLCLCISYAEKLKKTENDAHKMTP